MPAIDELRADYESARDEWAALRKERWDLGINDRDAEDDAEARMVRAKTEMLEAQLRQTLFLDLLWVIVAGRGGHEEAVGFEYAVSVLDDYAIAELANRLHGISAHDRIRLGAVR